MARTLLIDGDILCYKAAWKAQDSIDWEDGEEPQVLADTAAAEDSLTCSIATILDEVGGDPVVCLSDAANWRKELWPEYKGHRKKLPKPLLLKHCREWLATHYPMECWPRLEADDVMGILATDDPHAVIVSIDKDMRTVPANLFNPNRPEDGVVRVSPGTAFRNHMFQTLTGDSTDGYKGCPGVGPKKADAILDGSGPPPVGTSAKHRKQFEEWRKQLWQHVVKTYREKGLREEDALLNARLAGILTKGRYIPETAKILLWRPPR